MLYSADKDLDQYLRSLVRQGWVVEHRRGGHLVLRSPSGRSLTAPSTPSDWRAIADVRSRVRRIQRSQP